MKRTMVTSAAKAAVRQWMSDRSARVAVLDPFTGSVLLVIGHSDEYRPTERSGMRWDAKSRRFRWTRGVGSWSKSRGGSWYFAVTADEVRVAKCPPMGAGEGDLVGWAD